jgi:drug/metabolite transporter (DMT)-like permease
MPHESSNLRGAAAMIAATGLFVINDSFMKIVIDDLPPFEVLFVRGVFASIFCAGLVVLFGQGRQAGMMFLPSVIGRGLAEGLSVLCYIVALANMPIADVIAIGQTAPLMLILAAALILREPIGQLRLGLVAAGFAGAVMVAQPGSGGISLHVVLAFATALGIAIRDLIGRTVPAEVPGFVVALSTCLIVMTGAALMTGLTETWVLPSAANLAALLVAGLFVSLGHFAIFLAYRFGTPAAVAPFFYSFAVWAVISGYVVWQEVPNLMAATGIALIVASGLVLVLMDRRVPRRTGVPIEAAGELDL